MILNAAPARPFSPDLAGSLDLLVVNRIEAGMLSGYDVASADEASAAIGKIGQSRCDVIVTLGSGGLVIGPKDGPPLFIPATPVKAVSSHGAGDCFIGALGRALTRGAGLEEAARVASRTAARFVSLSEEERATADFTA